MMPGRSALTVTPFTASTVPIAFRVVDHVSCFATTVVTASGGGAQLCDIAALIWKYLNPPIAPTNTTTPASISNMRFFITKSEMYNVRPPRGVKKMWRPRVGAFTGLRTVERAFTARAPRACRCRSGVSPARGGCRYAPMWEGDDRGRPAADGGLTQYETMLTCGNAMTLQQLVYEDGNIAVALLSLEDGQSARLAVRWLEPPQYKGKDGRVHDTTNVMGGATDWFIVPFTF